MIGHVSFLGTSEMTDADHGLGQRKKSKMWEQLKKDARKLEGELEMKLSQYARISSGVESSSASSRGLQAAPQLHSDIANLLKRLHEVHDAMEVDISGSDLRRHTVVRHKEILQDFSHEFRRLSAQVDQVCPSSCRCCARSGVLRMLISRS